MQKQDNDKTAAVKRIVLLVDDDTLILGLLAQILQLAGYDTMTATSSRMALELLSESPFEPDLVILDVGMPGMSGLELARHLQSEAISFMFVSANEDEHIVEAATRHGALGYLVKPIDAANIVPSVKAAVARADEIRQLRETENKLSLALQNGREASIAVGILMERYKTDRNTAFNLLRDHARSNRRKLNEVAKELLSASEMLNALSPLVRDENSRKT